MRRRFPKTFRVRTLLAVVGVAAFASALVTTPSRNAAALCDLINNARVIGGDQYLKDTLSRFNSQIQDGGSPIPTHAFGFRLTVKTPTLEDHFRLQHPIEVQFTTDPIPSTASGRTVRHYVNYNVSLFKKLHETARSEMIVNER